MSDLSLNSSQKRAAESLANFKIPKRARLESNEEDSITKGVEAYADYEDQQQQKMQQVTQLVKTRGASGVHTPEDSRCTVKASHHPGRKLASVKNHEAKYTNEHDPTLPPELLLQFQPLFCRLCSAHLSSNMTAKVHYMSVNHEKKVRKFLIEHARKTGEPLHPRASARTGKKLEENDPKHFYCEVCDLPLTGRIHAESHYLGKNHQKALIGRPPAGKGKYDINGRWIRKLPSAAPPDGRDNFGLSFLPATEVSQVAAVEIKANELRCDVCQVAATSDQQLAMHLNGKKHKKRMKQCSYNKLVSATEALSTDETAPVNEAGFLEQLPEDSNALQGAVNVDNEALLQIDEATDLDMSIYRTPTGLYYCKLCDYTLSLENAFKQHLNSKKHHKNVRDAGDCKQVNRIK